MPDLDELIRDHLERRARPAAADPELFHAIDRRRARRSVSRRMGAAGVAIAVLVGTAALFAILGHTGGVSPATKSATPPAGPVDVAAIVSVSPADYLGYTSLWAGPLQLTPRSHDIEPTVDPSGRLVAFVRTSSHPWGPGALFTVPFAGVPAGPCPTCGFLATQLLGPSWNVSDPAWSPDGTKIAFAGGGPSRAAGIYMLPSAGGSPVLVYPVQTDLASVGGPSWSPDGTEIVFSALNGAVSDDSDLYVVHARRWTMVPRHVVDITPGGTDSQVAPTWSPDGTRIAFSLQKTGWNNKTSVADRAWGLIATVAPDGSGLQVLTSVLGVDFEPAWSPDGRFLAFTRWVGRTTEMGIYYVPASGGTPVFVRPGIDPAWRPEPPLSHTSTPVGSTMIPGVGYPVCNVNSATGRFILNSRGADAYFFTRAGNLSCAAADSSNPYYLALTVYGLGPLPSTVISGPFTDCRFGACGILAAPTLDGGRSSYLAIELMPAGPAISGNPAVFELYRASESGVFAPVTERGNFTSFPWGRLGLSKGGVSCLSPSSIDVWWALKGPGAWHLTETFATLTGGEMIVTRKTTSVLAPGARLPAGGGSSFCGSPVTP